MVFKILYYLLNKLPVNFNGFFSHCIDVESQKKQKLKEFVSKLESATFLCFFSISAAKSSSLCK